MTAEEVHVSTIIFMHCFFSHTIDILTVANLREIQNILNDGHFPSSKWYDLGLSLGLLDPKLKTIKEDYPRDSDRCLRECLLLWLQTDDKATWTKLVGALYEIEEKSVAAYVNLSKNSIIE